MNPRLRTLGSGLVTCAALAWFGRQTVRGSGAPRIWSAVMLTVAVVTGAGAVLDRVRPRPARRRARERDGGTGG
ncbi:hypothetical protein AB0E62_27660 [Streptomyces sp. NPDC038707]|uniref:hypothetical protein n=1 Tax=Streptomyces sp. NPDC038707 TaxID=3154329 RepID=UPI0033CE3EAD